jgi:hypothetical protein
MRLILQKLVIELFRIHKNEVQCAYRQTNKTQIDINFSMHLRNTRVYLLYIYIYIILLRTTNCIAESVFNLITFVLFHSATFIFGPSYASQNEFTTLALHTRAVAK